MTLDRGSVSWPKGAGTLPSVFGGTRPERNAPESEGSRQVAVQAKFPPSQGRPNRPRISGIFTDRDAARSTGTMGKSPNHPCHCAACGAFRLGGCPAHPGTGPGLKQCRSGLGRGSAQEASGERGNGVRPGEAPRPDRSGTVALRAQPISDHNPSVSAGMAQTSPSTTMIAATKGVSSRNTAAAGVLLICAAMNTRMPTGGVTPPS